MIIRSSTLTATRRTLPLRDPSIQARRLVEVGPIDSFQPVAPVAQQLSVSQSAQTAVAPSSSSGGFFSKLWGGIKKLGANLLGQAGTWLNANVGGYITKAQTYVSNLVGGLLTKAGSWLSGLLASWQQKLNN